MLTRVKIISWGEEKKLVRSTLSSHKKNIRDFIKTAETRIRKANGYRGLLQTYATEWQELSKQCIELITFFLDMEQGHRQEQFMLYEWRKAILFPVQDQILDGVFRLVNAERSGESIDSTHVIAVRETFVTYSSDMDKKKFYRHHFEAGYIAAAVSFYEFRAKEYLAIAGPRLYMKYAAINLKKEDEKAQKYLPTENYGDESVKAFMQSLAEVLVTDHKDVILAECSDLIKVNDIEHLQIMLNLMERIYDGKRMMADILEKTIIDVAKAELEASDADGGTCLEDLITIFKRFDYLVEDAFHCDPRFLLARDQAYRFIVNDPQMGEEALQSTNSGMDGSIPQKWDFHERLANLVSNCAVSDMKSDHLEDRLKDALLVCKYIRKNDDRGTVETMLQWLKEAGMSVEDRDKLKQMFQETMYEELKKEIITHNPECAEDLAEDRESGMAFVLGRLLTLRRFMFDFKPPEWNKQRLRQLCRKIEILKECGSSLCLKDEVDVNDYFRFVNYVLGTNNARLRKGALEALECLMTEARAQELLETCFYHRWNTLLGPFPRAISLMNLETWTEVVRLCLNHGAKPSKKIINRMASNIGICKQGQLKAYLKTLLALLQSYRKQKKDVIPLDLDVLSDLYHINEDLIASASAITHVAYQSINHCVSSDNVMDLLFYIRSEDGIDSAKEAVKRKLEALMAREEQNWLKRSALHLAGVILRTEEALDCMPKVILEQYINAGDLHGSTPLHLAYLHHNKAAVKFLVSNGAKLDVPDNYGATPQHIRTMAKVNNEKGTLQSQYYSEKDTNTREHVDVLYQRVCQVVMETESGVLNNLKTLLVLQEEEARTLCNEMKEVFRRVMRVNKYRKYVKEFVIAGSLRERMKIGRLDEVDIQIRLVDPPENFSRKLHRILVKSLAKIEWDGLHLRPISVSNPWEFIWEMPGPSRGTIISVDVVPLIFYPEIDSQAAHKAALMTGKYQPHKSARFLKWGFCTGWRKCQLSKHLHGFLAMKPTCFAYDWDIIESLSAEERMSIKLAKALLEAYYWTRLGDAAFQKLPISTFAVKNVLFCYHRDASVPIVEEEEEEIEDGDSQEEDEINSDGESTSEVIDDNYESGDEGKQLHRGEEVATVGGELRVDEDAQAVGDNVQDKDVYAVRDYVQDEVLQAGGDHVQDEAVKDDVQDEVLQAGGDHVQDEAVKDDVQDEVLQAGGDHVQDEAVKDYVQDEVLQAGGDHVQDEAVKDDVQDEVLQAVGDHVQDEVLQAVGDNVQDEVLQAGGDHVQDEAVKDNVQDEVLQIVGDNVQDKDVQAVKDYAQDTEKLSTDQKDQYLEAPSHATTPSITSQMTVTRIALDEEALLTYEDDFAAEGFTGAEEELQNDALGKEKVAEMPGDEDRRDTIDELQHEKGGGFDARMAKDSVIQTGEMDEDYDGKCVDRERKIFEECNIDGNIGEDADEYDDDIGNVSDNNDGDVSDDDIDDHSDSNDDIDGVSDNSDDDDDDIGEDEDGDSTLKGIEGEEDEALQDVKWTTEADVDTYAEEGRLLTCMIFEKLLYCSQQYEVFDYWAGLPSSLKPGDCEDAAEVCKCILQRLRKDVFY